MIYLFYCILYIFLAILCSQALSNNTSLVTKCIVFDNKNKENVRIYESKLIVISSSKINTLQGKTVGLDNNSNLFVEVTAKE